jgi:hypothetical protein
MSFPARRIDPVSPPSADRPVRNILAATGLAFAVAAVLLFVAVLPAEYGFDPLGTGRLLGLTALAENPARAIEPQPAPYKLDSTEFELGPYEFLEYKYRIEKGGAMIFSWQATGPVMYDFHSEPDGAPEGYAQSFDKQQTSQAHGTYTAPFSGIHGWFWENPGSKTVRITLTSAGFYSAAQEFKDNDSSFHPLTDVKQP